jgi:RNA polymerase sigma-70 factor, ECF subfamily
MTNRRQMSDEKARPLWRDVPEYELLRLAKAGNIPAFEELVTRTTDVCLRVATSILRSREDARDEVQNAFWLAYSRLELFTYQSKFSSWMVRIVINCCFLRLRSCQRKPIVATDVATDDGWTLPYEAVTSETPEIDLGRREVNQALQRELRAIPPLLRVPIELHYIDELPVKEVARELGLTISAVKGRLHRGQLFLRGRMLKHAPRSGPASLTANH